jgi:hypothetical protein
VLLLPYQASSGGQEIRSFCAVEVDTLMFLVDRSEEHRDHPINIVRRAGYRPGAAENAGSRWSAGNRALSS